VKNKQVMGELVGSLMVLGKLLVSSWI